MNSSFDLDVALAAWRTRFSSHEGIRPSTAVELEGHLRDSIDDLQQRGLSTEEAFVLATHRLGDQCVAKEMQEADPNQVWAARARWMFLGILGYHVFTSALLCIRSAIGAAALLLHASIVSQTASIFATAITVSIVIWTGSRLATGRWRVQWPRCLKFLANPWWLIAAMICTVLLSRLADSLWTGLAARVFSVSGFQLVYRTSSWSHLTEGLSVLVVLAFAIQRAKRVAEA